MKLVLALLTILSFSFGCAPSTVTVPTEAIPTAAATAHSVPALPQPSATSPVSGYAFPSSIDIARRYMFYLHGKIVEDVGLPAVSPEFGEYEYTAILKALESHGFVVISEQRARNTDAGSYALRVVEQLQTLLKAGVPAGSITVVGASKGGYMAATVSFLLDEPALNYVLIGTCYDDAVDQWVRDGMLFHGNILTIRDVADVEYSGSCSALFPASEGKGLGRHTEIVLHVGTGHGILYKPLDAWVLPTVQWATE